MSGCWIGLVSVKGDVVSIDFNEDVTAQMVLLKPFIKGYLKKQQARYISDLRKIVEKNNEKNNGI